MKKIGNIFVLIGLFVILLPITILIFSGVLGFFFGCTGSVTGNGVSCANGDVLSMVEFMQGFGFYGVFGIWYVGLPALLVGFILKSIGQKVTEQNHEASQLDTVVFSTGSLLTKVILLVLAAIFWWVTVPMYVFFIFKYKSMQVVNEKFKKFIFG